VVSDDPTQIIRAPLAAWSRGDLEAALEELDQDILFVSSGLFPGVAATYRGHEGFRQFWNDFRAIWEQITVHVDEIVEGRPDHYAMLGHFEAVGRNGIPVGRPIGMVFVVQDDRVLKIQSHATHEATLNAAGV
jgi:ketosteroid isomerase-like protein